MTEPGILAQLAIPAAVEQVLLAVPANSKARIQGFTFTNRSGSADTFRLSFSLRGAATSSKDYVYYNLPLDANDTFLSELDFTLDGTGVVRVFCSLGNISVTMYGQLT